MKPPARQRIAFFVSALNFGGMEKHTISLLNSLDTSLFDLSLVLLRGENPLLEQVNVSRLREVEVLDARGRIDLAAARRLRRWLTHHPQDTLVSVNEYPMMYAWLATRAMRHAPAMVDIFHTTIYRTRKERAQLALYRPIFASMDLLVYVSRKQQEYWHARSLRAARDLVIQNGIDVDRFHAGELATAAAGTRQVLGFSPSDYVICICAALRPEKAHQDMIAAIARLRAAGLPAKGLFVGDGIQRSFLQGQIDAAGLTGHVIITGMQADVRPFICASDVCALTSHAIETFSVAALEAMALERPMVMTRIGGAEEQVQDGINGFLYSPGDLQALVGHLRHLADPRIRQQMGRTAAQLVRERFTDRLMLTRYTDAFLSLARDP